MALQTLEIHRIGPEGEVLRTIRCISGRINVLRSAKPEDLARYRAALHGAPIDSRFALVLDGQAFIPNDHWIICKRPIRSAPGTVGQYLERHGQAAASRERLLVSLGLGGLTQQALNDLSDAQYRLIELVAALSSDRTIVIVDEPFEGIPAANRENVAQFLVDAVRNSDRMVIITGLSYRPEVWIEHELVSRVLLERPRQPTIGFGSSSAAADDAPPKATLLPKPRAFPISDTLGDSESRFWRRVSIPALITACCLGLVFAMEQLFESGPGVSRQTAALLESSSPDREGPTEVASVGVASRGQTQDSATVAEGPQGPTALGALPSSVQQAVLAAYADPEGVTRTRSQRQVISAVMASPREPVAHQDTTASVPIENEADMIEIERRREEIRQQFIEALRTAQDHSS